MIDFAFIYLFLESFRGETWDQNFVDLGSLKDCFSVLVRLCSFGKRDLSICMDFWLFKAIVFMLRLQFSSFF
jgi:hypothetical protein